MEYVSKSTNKGLKHLITTTPWKFKSKPSKHDIGKDINYNLNIPIEVTIELFADLICAPYSIVFSPARFSGNRSNVHWVSQSIFALDFDDGLTLDKAIEISLEHGLEPNVSYTTFSDSPTTPKFRLVYFIDKVISNPNESRYIQQGLINIFKKNDHLNHQKKKDKFYCDTSCSDLSRFYFGGLKSKLISKGEIPYSKLYTSCEIATIKADNGRTRKLAEYDTSYIYTIRSIKNNQNEIPSYLSSSTLTNKSFDFNTACANVLVLKDFANGKWLYHQELFGIATNLHWANGGLKWMKGIMDKHNELGSTFYTDNNYSILPYVNKRKYLPQSLSSFGYEQDHKHTNILTATYNFRGNIERTKTFDQITLEEAEQIMRSEFLKDLNANDNRIYILKLPTGIGKTKMVADMTDHVLIAAPTHRLKEEIASRISNRKKMVTPEMPEFDDKTINTRIDYYRRMGAVGELYSYLGQIRRNQYLQHSFGDSRKASDYFDFNNRCYESEDTILTTHAKVIHKNGFKHTTVIFDEDPLDNLIEVNSLDYSKLLTFLQSRNELTESLEELLLILDSINSLPNDGKLLETGGFDIDIEAITHFILNEKIAGNVLGLLESDYIIANPDKGVVNCCKKKDLPEQKCIILSATAPTDIYKKLYGDRVVVVDLLDVEQVGEIVQHTDKSYSRSSLTKGLDEIVEKIGDTPVITFAKYKEQFKNPDPNMHFGNCEGYDTRKGQDIAVVGTPHRANESYLFTAQCAGININHLDRSFSYRKVHYNGFSFMFNTFNEPQLRAIQLACIESELMQATGRSRTLRTDARVDLYSNFPLRVTTEFRNNNQLIKF